MKKCNVLLFLSVIFLLTSCLEKPSDNLELKSYLTRRDELLVKKIADPAFELTYGASHSIKGYLKFIQNETKKVETKIIDFIQDTDDLSRSLELPNQAKLHLQYRKNKFIGIKVEYQKNPHTKIIEHYVDNGLNGFDLTQDKYEREINGILSSLPEEEQILEISFMNYLVHFYNYLINPEGELPHISTNDKALRYPYDIPEAGVINWREIEQGLEFTFIDVLFQKELVERIALTRIDPEYYALKTYNDYDKIVTKHGKQFKHYGRKTIEEWQDYLDANVVVNGSFYRTKPYGKATAQMLENGKRKGSKLYPTGGTILFEPQDRKAPYLKVVDHLDNMQNLEDYGYNYGTNGYPAFYDSNGDSRSKKSYYKWRATRTFIGVDDTGKVLMGNTQEGFFALWRIGHFLQKLENVLNLKGEGYILNMDGGPPACIAVKTEDSSFQYNWYGYTEGNNTKEIVWNVKNKKKWRIPSVVAAIRREEGEN